jgi:hypothetical protein
MNTRRKLLLLPFWLAVLLTVLGNLISFVPGAECGWFLVVAVLSVSAAALLLILALAWTYSDYRRGVEYRQWRSSDRTQTP